MPWPPLDFPSLPTILLPSDPVVTPAFKEPTPYITLPKDLGRPPTQRDLLIKRTFDGLSPKKAREKVLAKISNPIAKENLTLTQNQIDNRVRDMQAALNNLYTPGTLQRQFFEAKNPQAVVVHSTLSDSSPVYYEVLQAGEQTARFYARDWSGKLNEVPRPQGPTVMSASVRLDPPGINMTYPTWSMPQLAGPLTTITEGR